MRNYIRACKALSFLFIGCAVPLACSSDDSNPGTGKAGAGGAHGGSSGAGGTPASTGGSAGRGGSSAGGATNTGGGGGAAGAVGGAAGAGTAGTAGSGGAGNGGAAGSAGAAGTGGAAGSAGTGGAAGTAGAGGAGVIDAGLDACAPIDAGALQSIYLSDLNFASPPTNGWGPVERDMSNGEMQPGDGHQISLNGTKYTKGLGAHAVSIIEFNLEGKCSTFTASVGKDDEIGFGTVTFEVRVDGAVRYQSPLKGNQQPAEQVSVDVSCGSTLQLIVNDGGDGNGGDHADWADAKITCSSVPSGGLFDAGVGQPDSGASDAGADVSVQPDGGSSDASADSTDAGSASTDASSDSEASSDLPDAGADSSSAPDSTNGTSDATDASADVANDACVMPDAALLSTFYLSDLPFVGTPTNGWGPVERDKSNGENKAGDGTTITINGVTFPKGIGAHATSLIDFNLEGKCSTFTASVGKDDEIGFGTVAFEVWVDGTMRYQSPVKGNLQSAEAVSVDVSCASTLELRVTDGGDGNGGDHADWGDAKITCTSAPGIPPDASSD